MQISNFLNGQLVNQSFRSLMACGSSGSLISLICCGMFMFFTADIALVGAADNPA